MSDFARNAKAVKEVFKKDSIIPGKMGNSIIEGYDYGDNLARNRRVSMQNPVSKSWLFEIVDRKNSTIDESFTLILPPQAYTIKEAQRVSITKTFGNAFVDDYGADNLEITLKGISGTAHVFPTYQSKAGSSASEYTDVALVAEELNQPLTGEGYDGRNAFYYFRDKIMRYKSKDGWDKKELRVYDLADEQSYRCVLLDFTLDRTSAQPLHYPFTISLFVYDRLDNFKPKLKPINISKDPIAAANAVDSLSDKIGNLYQNVQDIVNATAMIRARSLELRTRWNRALAETSRVLTSPLDAARNLNRAVISLMGIVSDSYRIGKYTFDRYVGAVELAGSLLDNAQGIYGFQISEGWQRVQKTTIEIDDGLNTSGGATGTTSPSASQAVSRNATQQSYSFSGLRLYTVKGNDTLSSIALNEMGDDTLWPFIADVNPEITSSEDLVSGEQIFIPLQTDPTDSAQKERFIFSEDPTRDPYGTDIRLDSNGNLMFQSDDVALISGVYNVQQAIDLRLNTEVGSLIKQSAYGMSAQAGIAGSSMSLRYLKMAIRTAVIQDPRVASVDDLIVSLNGDALQVSMTVSIVGFEGSIPVPLEL